jgi:hypothetical protein
MLYRKSSGDEHKRHRDHGFNGDKCTLLFSPRADECKHTGGWESQVVIPEHSTLTVEKEVTRVASDGQWICFTPWSNAVNTHLWGFGKVPRAPHAAPLASAVSSGRWQHPSLQAQTTAPTPPDSGSSWSSSLEPAGPVCSWSGSLPGP